MIRERTMSTYVSEEQLKEKVSELKSCQLELDRLRNIEEVSFCSLYLIIYYLLKLVIQYIYTFQRMW